MKKLRLTAVSILSALFAVLPVAKTSAVASTVVVTPANTQGWSTADTRPGGA